PINAIRLIACLLFVEIFAVRPDLLNKSHFRPLEEAVVNGRLSVRGRQADAGSARARVRRKTAAPKYHLLRPTRRDATWAACLYQSARRVCLPSGRLGRRIARTPHTPGERHRPATSGAHGAARCSSGAPNRATQPGRWRPPAAAMGHHADA